jgi:XTP/dITP diphosphohydrolase
VPAAPPIKALLASGNPHKLAELREVLSGWRIEPLVAAEAPEETGSTYRDNALIKARFGRDLAPAAAWVLGEDSGIECRALDGGPGLLSARWAGGGDEADLLLERLADEAERRARMVSELVALSPAGQEFHAVGVMEGQIATFRRGRAGFGYDPVFVPDGAERTVAELGEAWKRRHSHRALAAMALAAAVEAATSS